MRHDVEDAMSLHDLAAGFDGDVMPGFDAECGVDFQVHIHQEHVAHLAGSQVMNAGDARCLEQGLADRFDLVVVGSAIHQVMQGVPGELPAHLAHHESDNRCCDRVQDRIASEVADDPDADDQRGCGIGAGMPGVGNQQARLHALGHAQHVPEQQLLGDQSGRGHPECGTVHLRHGMRVLQLEKRGPEHADTDGEQQGTQRKRGGRLESMMAIRMVGVRILLAEVAGQQNDEIGQQVG